MTNHNDQLAEVLKGWLEFSKDVRASCPAGEDWLDRLRAETQEMLQTLTLKEGEE